MTAYGTQVRVWVSRRRAWVTARDHHAARRATPGRCPRGASPRGQAQRMLRIVALSPCRPHHGARRRMVSHAPRRPHSSPRTTGKPAGARCPLATRPDPRAPGTCGQRWHGRWPRAGTRHATCNTGLACRTRPSPPAGPCGRTPCHPTVTKDILDGHAPDHSAPCPRPPARRPGRA